MNKVLRSFYWAHGKLRGEWVTDCLWLDPSRGKFGSERIASTAWLQLSNRRILKQTCIDKIWCPRLRALNQVIKGKLPIIVKIYHCFLLPVSGSDDKEWRTDSNSAKTQSDGEKAVEVKYEPQLNWKRGLGYRGHLLPAVAKWPSGISGGSKNQRIARLRSSF